MPGAPVPQHAGAPPRPAATHRAVTATRASGPVPHVDRRGGQRRAALGDHDDPAHRPGGRGGDHLAQRRPHQADQAARQAEHRGRGDRPARPAGWRATATRLIWPDSAVTTGVQATWAASGTETASAAHRGSHAIRASRQPGARNRMPPVASTESAKPAETASAGHHEQQRRGPRRPRHREPRSRPLLPMPTSATVPIAAARTTLGSVRAMSTKPTMPAAATAYVQRPRTPSQRATTSRNPTSSVRLVPLTASRWVSPVVRKSSASAGSSPLSSPTTRAGTSSRGCSAARARRTPGSSAARRRLPATTRSGPADDLGATAHAQQRGRAVVRRRQPPRRPGPAPPGRRRATPRRRARPRGCGRSTPRRDPRPCARRPAPPRRPRSGPG